MKKYLLILLLLQGFQQYAQNITRIEYWVDGDPGFGLATQVAATQAPVLSNIIANDVLSIVPGMHVLGIRSRDANGKWSQTNLTSFSVAEVIAPTHLARLEYFWDGDSGFGENNVIDLPAGATNLSAYILMANVPAGFAFDIPHILFIRTVDDRGKYSQTNRVEIAHLGTADFKTSEIQIYPNPVEEVLHVDLAQTSKTRLLLYDISGKMVGDTMINNRGDVPMAHLSAGVYTAYFWTDSNMVYSTKIIKK